ncbi:MAG: homocysteine S-methyltransferase [Phaeodactylibacter sp.]|uniref:homocysteine S-methyltransferase n=1 Tax=Phaeodactylibacter sp. TaxID=1940289 RepID=UPI0032EDB707
MQRLLNRALPLLLDGALATELEHRGADLSGGLWSAHILKAQPELIREVHLDYFRAGADVAITASYQATLPGFLQAGYSATEAEALLRRSVKLAKEARTLFCSESSGMSTPLIAASVGPYGAYLADGAEYRGRYGLSDEALRDFHQPRIEWLLSETPDLLAFETLPSLQEAKVLLEMLEAYPEAQAWFSFTAKDAAHISEGQPLAEAGQLLGAHPQVVAIGFNCVPPHLGTALLANLARHTSKPLVIYPNSGEGWDAEQQCWLPSYRVPKGFGSLPEAWLQAGAGLIGGCCRTRPEDIQALRQLFAR